jgi:hypothetical protein
MPKRHQSFKNPNDNGHGLGLSPPRTPQRKRTLIVNRDSYTAAPDGDEHQYYQEGKHDRLGMSRPRAPQEKSTLMGSCGDHHHSHERKNDGFGMSPPRTPHRNTTLIVNRDSYKAPKSDDHHCHQEEQDCIMIEVAPGTKLPLRGNAETWSAIEEGSVTITMCISCNIDLNCIIDAQLVICPGCLLLSPVDQTIQGTADATMTMHRHGVGVGIKAEDVQRWVMNKYK